MPRTITVFLCLASSLFMACDSDTPQDGGLDLDGDADADATADDVGDADDNADVDEVSDADTDDDEEPSHAPEPTGFRRTGSLSGARTGHTATLLSDGRVLVVGGENIVSRDMIDTVELFDPETETWTEGPSLPEPRSNHIALLLEDGRVLIAGGGRSAPIGAASGLEVLDSAMLFDPETDSWSETGGLNEGRSHFAAVLLSSGRVLVAGGGAGTHEHGSTCNGYGVDDCGPLGDTLGSAEIFDPDEGTFTPTGSMNEPRDQHTLTALPDGRAIAIAGVNDYAESFATTEIFDETTETWTDGPELDSLDRFFHNTVVLPSGRLLVGGGKKSNTAMLDSVVFVDVDAGTSTETASLSVPHTSGAFVRLESGRILSAGGFTCPSPCAPIYEAEIFDEETEAWTPINPLNGVRSGFSATLLQDGRVLIAGGFNSMNTMNTCEITEP